jgi:hypothetical protein
MGRKVVRRVRNLKKKWTLKRVKLLELMIFYNKRTKLAKEIARLAPKDLNKKDVGIVLHIPMREECFMTISSSRKCTLCGKKDLDMHRAFHSKNIMICDRCFKNIKDWSPFEEVDEFFLSEVNNAINFFPK